MTICLIDGWIDRYFIDTERNVGIRRMYDRGNYLKNCFKNCIVLFILFSI